jgi:hypothetical protein
MLININYNNLINVFESFIFIRFNPNQIPDVTGFRISHKVGLSKVASGIGLST